MALGFTDLTSTVRRPDKMMTSSSTPSILLAKFGDGYEQRLQDGINNDLLTLSVTFDKRNELETTAINHFLNQRKGAEAFVFTPPAPFATAAKFICKSFNTNYVFFDNYTVSATFEQTP